ncbi:MAG TPA: hypothetical protein VF601_16150 [Beijerinckiaceae bacterium]|jgi:hypothetical protein
MADDELPLEALVAEEPDVPEPDVAVPAEPVAGVSETPVACEPEAPALGPVPVVEGCVPTLAPVPGCIAGEPEVVEPEPVAAGRSVAPEGPGGLVVD